MSKTQSCYIDMDDPKDVTIIFGISNYEVEKSMPREKNKAVTGLIKKKLGQKITAKVVTLNMYSS